MRLVALLQREPVRTYLYGVLVAVLAALAAMGVVTATLVPVLLGVGAAVLAVPAVEVARAKVSPVVTTHVDGLGPDVPEEVWLDKDVSADHLEDDELDTAKAVEEE